MNKKEEEPTFEKQIELAVAELEKKFGIGSILRMDAKPFKIDVIPTHSILLNQALGIGGFPLGRICEIYGIESSGKTTLAMSIMINAQKEYPNKEVAVIDAEHTFDINYAEDMGLDISKVWISQPDSAEEALDIVERLLKTDGFSCIIVDSTAALVPQDELEIGFSDNLMAVQARLLSKAMRKLNPLVYKTNCNLTFISQLRANINPMSRKKLIQTGGNAIKFYATVRVNMQVTERLNKSAKSKYHGNKVKISVDKNKLAPPHRICETTIYYGMGIMKEIELIDLGVELGLIQKGGAWYTFNETKFAGQEKLLDHLFENPENLQELEEKIQKGLTYVNQ